VSQEVKFEFRLVGAFVLYKQIGKLLLERGDFRAIADFDVRVIGILERVILVVIFGLIEGLQRRYIGNNFVGENLGGVKLRDVCLGDALLGIAGVKDYRA